MSGALILPLPLVCGSFVESDDYLEACEHLAGKFQNCVHILTIQAALSKCCPEFSTTPKDMKFRKRSTVREPSPAGQVIRDRQ
jgi:hypothetical protein